jgi:hypothetical protein
VAHDDVNRTTNFGCTRRQPTSGPQHSDTLRVDGSRCVPIARIASRTHNLRTGAADSRTPRTRVVNSGIKLLVPGLNADRPPASSWTTPMFGRALTVTPQTSAGDCGRSDERCAPASILPEPATRELHDLGCHRVRTHIYLCLRHLMHFALCLIPVPCARAMCKIERWGRGRDKLRQLLGSVCVGRRLSCYSRSTSSATVAPHLLRVRRSQTALME